MSSEGLVYQLKAQNTIDTPSYQNPQFYNPGYTFYAEKHNGTFVNDDKSGYLGPTFICQYLHVFELQEVDMQNGNGAQNVTRPLKSAAKAVFT